MRGGRTDILCGANQCSVLYIVLKKRNVKKCYNEAT